MAMTTEPEYATLRVSDVDRGQALARLQQAQLEGRLTGEELEERIAKVEESRTGVHFTITGSIGTGSAKVSYRRRGLFKK